ncbi:alpha-N-acetylglucosaminidase [Odoribacter laneus]|uniref:alpha-N-acetylglucosaminidase n=3 Tax=Odoribacter laneus TaxID=626933 RepID=UPI00189A079B|nr:alpha-N-acetylglucosaminidase [Odoribacter laneus]
MRYIIGIVWLCIGCMLAGCTDKKGTLDKEAAYALIKRVVAEKADHFKVEYVARENGKDVFELEQKGKKIVLRGNNGISVASALNHYLNEYAHCQYGWNASHMQLPDPLPEVKQKVRKVTPYVYRHYFNYCTFSYTAAWWDWERWQKEIDYMALHGVNMPLAMTGQNAVWDRVYRSMGFTDEDMDRFFTGPGYFMWFWAGNIDGWCGPLPKSWMESHEELQKKILARERELGMTPILPAFTGHVPPTFKEHFPEARLRQVNWEGRFDDTYLLEADDPLFQTIGNRFMEEQIRTFGTDHLYGADTFNEMFPPSEDSTYLDGISKAVYQSMAAVDPEAVWVMQGWLFHDKRDFWKPAQMKAYLGAVPDEHLIVLDLWGEEFPIWDRTEAFYGKPWIWCMLHNFGGRNMLFGNALKLAEEPSRVLADPAKGQLLGLGAVPEGIEQNPVIYSLLFSHIWRNTAVELDEWFETYLESRYGCRDEAVEKAWDILRKTVYANEGNYESAITARPTFEKHNNWAYTDIPYDPVEVIKAWKYLLQAADRLGKNPCYRYDLILVGKQVLANYATIIQQKFGEDYRTKDLPAFTRNSREFMELIDDMDELMGTHEAFLLGKWLEDARSWGKTASEKQLYEKNARDQITLWGGKDAVLHDYASKQWSGLFKGFYKGRWQLFIDEVYDCIKTGRKYDHTASDDRVRSWEWEWVNGQEKYPAVPQGDPVVVSERMFGKYIKKLQQVYDVNF